MSTLSERILDAPAGTYVDREVDLAFAHDGTGILAREALREMGVERLAHPERLRLIFDHIVPANTGMAATLQAEPASMQGPPASRSPTPAGGYATRS